jgi:hypothetical protein
VVILGGDGKGQDFRPLAEPLVRHARAVVLIGRDAPLMREQVGAALAEAGVPLEDAADLPAGGGAGRPLAHAGDAVLMSPACASLDMFDNYVHRAACLSRPCRAGAERGMSLEVRMIGQLTQRCRCSGRAGSPWLPRQGDARRAGNGADGLPVRLSNRTYAGTRQVAVRELGFDQPLLWVVVALLAWGLVMVYSASIALPDNPRFANYAHTHFVLRHGSS